MAFYEDDDLENQDPDSQAGGGVQTSAQSGVITGAGGQSSNAPQAPAGSPDKGSSGFVGIKQYLDANKPQAAKLGDQTAGIINTSANQARQSIGGLNQAADTAIKPVNQIDEGTSQKLGTAAETLTADERNRVKQTANAQYSGPKVVTDLGDAYSNAQKATNTATQNINNSGTEQGRMNLISQINSKPRTQGMNVFDNTLLQAGGGREKLAQASTANQDVKGSLDAASQAIQSKIGQADDPNTLDVDESSGAIGQTGKAQADAYKKIQDAMSSWQSGFQPKVKQAQDALVNQANTYTEDLGTQDELSGDLMNIFGLENGENLYDVDLNNYLTKPNAGDISAENVASAEDYARYAALAELSGQTPSTLDPSKAHMAGQTPKFTANTDKLRNDLRDQDAISRAQFNVQNQLGDVAHLFGSVGQVSGAKTPETYADLQDFVNEVKQYGNPEWVADSLQGGGGSAGASLRGIEKFLADLKANQRSVRNRDKLSDPSPPTKIGEPKYIPISQYFTPVGKG